MERKNGQHVRPTTHQHRSPSRTLSPLLCAQKSLLSPDLLAQQINIGCDGPAIMIAVISVKL